MESRHLLKIRLKQDGTWEHVYSVPIAEIAANHYQNMSRDEILEEAVELSHYKDAKVVIDRIRYKN